MSTKRPQIRSRETASVRAHYERVFERVRERRAFYLDELTDEGVRFLDHCAYAAVCAIRAGGEWTPVREAL